MSGLTLFVLGGLTLIILFASGIALVGAARTIRGVDLMDERMQVYASLPEISQALEMERRYPQLNRLRLRLNRTLAAFASADLSLRLMSANWPISAAEFTVIRLSSTIIAFLLGWILSDNPIAGLGLSIIAFIIPGYSLSRSLHRRRTRFANQLIDVLVLINGAIRAGFSLLQATEVVVKEMKPPANEEFRRVQHEVALGVTLGTALNNLAIRMENQDLDLLVAAINIQYKVGGNMTTMISAVTETIRERIQLFTEVRVISTQQRYTGYLLTLLPFFVGAVIFTLSPEYMSLLFTRQMICFPIGALLGIIMGNIVIRRIARIQV
jgi:tight adherence protein B